MNFIEQPDHSACFLIKPSYLFLDFLEHVSTLALFESKCMNYLSELNITIKQEIDIFQVLQIHVPLRWQGTESGCIWSL
jgi:hypothetical protein